MNDDILHVRLPVPDVVFEAAGQIVGRGKREITGGGASGRAESDCLLGVLLSSELSPTFPASRIRAMDSTER